MLQMASGFFSGTFVVLRNIYISNNILIQNFECCVTAPDFISLLCLVA